MQIKLLVLLLLRHGIKKIPELFRMQGYSKISTLESGFKKLGILMLDPPYTCGGSPIRKEEVVD